jgi:hypothetical protein
LVAERRGQSPVLEAKALRPRQKLLGLGGFALCVARRSEVLKSGDELRMIRCDGALANRERETVVRESFVVAAGFMVQSADEVKLAGHVRMMGAVRILSRCQSQERLSKGGVVMIPVVDFRGCFRYRQIRSLGMRSVKMDPPQSNATAEARRACAAIQCGDRREIQMEEPLG